MSSLFSKKEQKKSQSQYLDFDQLAQKKYQYDAKKGNDQSHKQEQYINELKKGYEQQRLEIEPLFQKVDLLQIERKQLMDEIEQYKISQQEILKKFDGEYQEKEKLQKECLKYKQQVQTLQKMQMPKEFQEKQCQELKESLFITIKDIMNDFLENYNHMIDYQDENNFSKTLLDELLQQIDDSIVMFVENLPAQSSRQFQNDEVQHLKEQLEKALQQTQLLQSENSDLSVALESEKQHKDKIINQRNTQQQLVNQLQTQIEQMIIEKKNYESQYQEIQMKYIEIQSDLQNAINQKEEEKEKLKSNLVDSISELQQQISKLQKENTQLLKIIQDNENKIDKDQEIQNNVIRELESRLNQETIKFEQKTREFVRLERELTQQKNENLKLYENNNILQQQLDTLNNKRIKDKEIFEEQKEKYKKIKVQYQQLENENKEKLQVLQDQIQQLEQQIEAKSDINKNYVHPEIMMEKELQISKLDQIVQELKQKNGEFKQQIIELKVNINTLEQEIHQQKQSNQSHQEKRSLALSEIKRLEQQNETQKLRINELNQEIIKYQQEISQILQQQQSKNYNVPQLNKSIIKSTNIEINNNNNLNSSKISDTESQVSKQSKAQSMIMKGLDYFRGKKVVIMQQQENPDRKIAEKALQNQAEDLKQNLEMLYKSYLSTLILNQNGSEDKLIKFERQINECVKKTQDLYDNIEDFLIL